MRFIFFGCIFYLFLFIFSNGIFMKSFFIFSILGLTSMTYAYAQAPSSLTSNITIEDINHHQTKWCDALINISKTYQDNGLAEAKKQASQMIDEQYLITDGDLLFKPTLSQTPQTFRTTKEGALAYFVGDNPDFPNDKGFALKGWKKCNIENYVVKNLGNTALVMGKTHLEDKYGKTTNVDKTWGFVKDQAGNLRVFLHHSSLEYQPQK